ncbi:LysR family transcriptional regulator [uncultured Amaricoccus sp.]|uniref:LysR family transcriptional regulator n=1 Tax=uncultured Amaricoccus sp. TaxID=339341 RepID=UPI00261BE5A3|nr:LysR family transcriptional regulator [uncultured Amaricoccus sp.]
MDRLDCDRMFVAVMELGSFARAAERLGTSAGQASKMVARLEQDLGARLLNRTTRALAPTEVGRAYHERVRDILTEYESLDAQVKQAMSKPSGRLRLTAPLTFGVGHLAPILLEFAALYPAIELDVGFSDRVVSLVEEGFDAAIRVGRPADASLIARKLADVRLAVVGAPAYLERAGIPETPAALADHECVIDTNPRDPALWRFRAPDGSKLSVTVSGRLRFSDASVSLAAAEAGFGLAKLPDFVVAHSLRAGRLRRLFASYDDEPYGLYVLYPPGRHLAAKVRVLVDFLVERFRPLAAEGFISESESVKREATE